MFTIRKNLDPKCGAQFPKLNAFYEAVNATAGAKRYQALNFHPYFTVEAPKN